MRTIDHVRAALACGVAFSCPAAAQTATPDGAQQAPGSRAVPTQTQTQTQTGQIQEIVVTAQRKSERLSRVPISVSAFTDRKMEVLGIKSFADIVRFTPGVQFNNDRHDIAIRGISSAAGTGTTGVYIDDTPIQVRALGLNANNTLPNIFDLDRVEVLRGPQGTLFGAGSEGGTVRYITPAPSLDKYSVYARTEAAGVEKGSPNYEAGVAIGGPLVRDTLGFRASGWYRRDGGYVNRVDYRTGITTERDANYVDTYVVRAALGWAPAPSLLVTPSIFYQKRNQHNHDEYWVSLSDSSQSNFLSGTPDRQSDRDRFLLPALKIAWTGDSVQATSNTSYFDRKEVVNGYSGTLYNLSLLDQLLGAQIDFAGNSNPNQIVDPTRVILQPGTINLPEFPGYISRVFITNAQQNFTQELRLQSTRPNARFQWTAGIFYSFNRQASTEEIRDPLLPQLIPLLFGVDVPGFSNGVDLLPNGDSYINHTLGHDRQIALFGDATYAVTPKLKASIGLRYAWTKFEFTNYSDGPQNLGRRSGSGGKSETPFTPKINVSYQATPDDLYYGTISKGYRIGGASPPFPLSPCQADLTRLGLTAAPASYSSDSVWNYELGFKNKFLDRRLSIAASAFYLKWSNIQQANYLTSCGFQYTGNFGEVESKGFDAQFQAAVTRHLSLDLSLGYTQARYSKTTPVGTTGVPITSKGNTIPGVVPWTVSLGGQYSFELGGRDAFLRADYEFQSRNPYLTAQQDINNATNDPSLINDPSTHFVSVRSGITLGKLQAQAFIDNLLNIHPQYNLQHQDQYTALFEATTARPRTFGASLSYRY